MSKALIYKANSQVPIVSACKLIGMPEMGYSYGSPKMYCPFGDSSHMDLGATKAFRIYADTNTAYCFACGRQYRPVSLIALYNDISEDEAADYLIEFFQINEPSVDEKWAELTAEKPFSVDRADLIDSLKRYCARISPDWEARQFEPEVAADFDKCLALLSLLRTVEDVETWRQAAKTKMRNRLIGTNHG